MKPVFKKITILFLLLVSLNSLYSQVLPKKAFIKAVQEADIYYYYDQNYDKASELYESLIKIYPENANLLAKLGICF